ncbi:sugar ABC transporter ATP-binding protein [Halocella sp. SP3-1]|uniref:sugar ABC transporter ATP-binding protein n=1 Tax=Halocella sp. SP3-1 TaxID=2382161 RepID=UPI00256FF887|nr:sugar ABC transporter ATP-binding protein [Halocella sp. SP3-1]
MSGILLETRGVSKSFPGVKALDNINMEIRKGEVHALIGENGAGKSTFVKILAGAFQQDAGSIYIDQKEVEIANPTKATEYGISIIYQEFNLFSELSVAENMFIGREPLKNNGLIDWDKVYNDAANILNRLGVSLDLYQKIKDLKIAQQQMVEIAKAIGVKAKLVIMDEPSATLTEYELDKLFSIIEELKNQGISIIYISHRLEEIFEIADCVSIFRDGQHIATRGIEELTKTDIIRMMVGRKLEKHFPKIDFDFGDVILSVKDFYLEDSEQPFSFEVRQGEILGITGLVGAGRTELMRAVFGADPKKSGKIYLEGKEIHINEPKDAIDHGIALVPEDRKGQGLFLGLPLTDNITMSNINAVLKNGIIQHKIEEKEVSKYIDLINIKTPSLQQVPRSLSGGNQQKVVLAKWFFSESKVIIFDEPTRGIDVGAKVEIYNLMNKLLEEGKAIIMISSELPEVLGMSDRIMVIHEGKIQGTIDNDNATQEKIMNLATGEEEMEVV